MSDFITLPVHLDNPAPCPFCGSVRIVKGERCFAMCVDCGATGPERNADATRAKFTGDWNMRFTPTASVSPGGWEGWSKVQIADELRRRMNHFYRQADGTMRFPQNAEGDLLKMVALLML
jgi:hypothetical protein